MISSGKSQGFLFDEVVKKVKAYVPEKVQFPTKKDGSFYRTPPQNRRHYFSKSQEEYEYAIPMSKLGENITIDVERDGMGGLTFSLSGT